MAEVNSAPEKAKLLRFGLSTGQTLMVLTQQPVETDLDLLVITATDGDTVTVKDEHVVYTRSAEVDMPTEDELEAFKAWMQAATMTPDQARSAMGLGRQGPYL
jgi:hypothetical protein